jgi:hypothetical protein
VRACACELISPSPLLSLSCVTLQMATANAQTVSVPKFGWLLASESGVSTPVFDRENRVVSSVYETDPAGSGVPAGGTLSTPDFQQTPSSVVSDGLSHVRVSHTHSLTVSLLSFLVVLCILSITSAYQYFELVPY